MRCKFRIEKRRDKGTGEVITKNVPIYADINIKGMRINYPTGYRVDKERWCDIKIKDEISGEVIREQKVAKNCYGTRNGESVPYNIINDDLAIIQATVIDIVSKNPIADITRNMVISEIDARISKFKNREYTDEDNSFWGLFDKYIATGNVSTGRIKTYRNAYINLKNFEKFHWRRKIEFADCSLQMMEEFDKFMKNDGNNDGRYDNLSPKVRPKPKGHNTRIKIMRVLKAYFNWVQLHYSISVSAQKEYKVSQEVYEDAIFLTIDERDKVLALKLQDKKLEIAQDIFKFHTFMGARVSDLYDLTRDNITDDGYIEFIADKTIVENPRTIRIPLRKECKDIIDKYKDTPDDRLIPYMPKQTYNNCLKELVCKANITRKVSVINKITMREEKKYLWEVFGSHNVRKTFIASCKRRTGDNAVVASLSGHKPYSKAFYRYTSVGDEQKKETIDKI